MGGPKRDMDQYVKLIPPKANQPEPKKRLVHPMMSIEEAAFGPPPKRKNRQVPK